ncbi:type I glyceraldehyde-3-phosphate dehydrogenase [Dactylosporangium sp. CA-152071]|uniref:type I glyceraldehyde-3-phosphate dehydrogenase n=1 Tax=Dactylosporangium sp. CA-152071 TaxID=3239933 RepID=UPI003D93DB8D
MTYRIAINGFGRIGRDFIRCLVDRGMLGGDLAVVAVNDLYDTATLAHLLQHDSTFGRLRAAVDVDPSGGGMTVGGQYIEVLRHKDPLSLPWEDLDVDLVVESTGRFRARDDAAGHLKAGARKVLVSAPGKEVDATIVPGVNSGTYDPALHDVVSAASCTTNCAAPMAKVLHEAFGIEQGYLTTVHAYTNDQMVLDAPHKDPRRARTAAVNIIPTSTGAAKAIGLVLPDLAGRLGGVALRVPVENGSMTDLTCRLARPATAEQINAAFAAAAAGALAGILRYSEAPLVSRDIIGDPSSCVFDAGLTAADGHLVKVFGWYDNEWGYTNRLVDLAAVFAGISAGASAESER